jgi:transposase
MGDFLDFQRGQIVGVPLAGASVTKMATLLGVSRATFCKVMTTYKTMGGHHQPRGRVVENQK